MITYQELWHRLTALYELGEAQAVVRMLLDVQFGLTLTDVLTGKVSELSAEQAGKLEKMMTRLMQGEPVQYVLGQADFCGHTFGVAPGVLIPRPETAELVDIITAEEDNFRPHCGLCPGAPTRILDVGTGSGCIAISLALADLNSEVVAWDISPDALMIARDNAHRLGAKVNFVLQDVLQVAQKGEDTRRFDIIVSNPPYICQQERADMAANVLEHEPEQALFVPDDDPLLFYRAISEYAVTALAPGGSLYFEINPLYSDSMLLMLAGLGFEASVRKDSFGKLRFVIAHKQA